MHIRGAKHPCESSLALRVNFVRGLFQAAPDMRGCSRCQPGMMQGAVAGSKGGVYFAQTAEGAIPTGKTPAQYDAIYKTLLNSSKLARDSVNDEISSVQKNQQSILKASSLQGNTVTPPVAPQGAEYDYQRDLTAAQSAIQQGADQTQVMQRFHAKYK